MRLARLGYDALVDSLLEEHQEEAAVSATDDHVAGDAAESGLDVADAEAGHRAPPVTAAVAAENIDDDAHSDAGSIVDDARPPAMETSNDVHDDDVRVGARGIVNELEEDAANLEQPRMQSLQHVLAKIDARTKKRRFYAYNDAESYAFRDIRLANVTPSEFTCAFALRSNAGDREWLKKNPNSDSSAQNRDLSWLRRMYSRRRSGDDDDDDGSDGAAYPTENDAASVDTQPGENDNMSLASSTRYENDGLDGENRDGQGDGDDGDDDGDGASDDGGAAFDEDDFHPTENDPFPDIALAPADYAAAYAKTTA